MEADNPEAGDIKAENDVQNTDQPVAKLGTKNSPNEDREKDSDSDSEPKLLNGER
jgi:hypothetical protein